jgi:hypothetical protein
MAGLLFLPVVQVMPETKSLSKKPDICCQSRKSEDEQRSIHGVCEQRNQALTMDHDKERRFLDRL